MYHSGHNPLQRVSYKSKKMKVHTELKSRRVQKAFLRYHDPKSWPMLREALKDMGREDMIGSGKNALIPKEEPAEHRYARQQRNKAGESTRGRPGGKGGFAKPGSKSGTQAKSGQSKPGQGQSEGNRPSGKSFGKPGSRPGSKPGGKKPGKKLQKSVAEKAGVKQEGAKKSGKPKFKKR